MDAHTKNLGPYHQHEGEVYTKKGEGILIVERRERGGVEVHTGAIEEGIYSILQVALNGASVLCKKEEWKEEEGIGLLISQ